MEKILTEFDSINAQLADKVSWSYNADGRFAKFDIENFFNGVSQDKINDAWVHCFELWQEQMGGRRRFLAIPRVRQQKVIGVGVHSPCSGYKMRSVIKNKFALQPRAQANGRVSDDWRVVDLRHILRIIVFDLEFTYCRLGDSLIRSSIGTVQGSPLAPSLCCLVLSVTEHYNLSGMLGMSKKWYCSAFRWIDDIFLICVHFKEDCWSFQRC